MCTLVATETMAVAEHIGICVCDITNATTLMIKMLSATLASNLPEICEIEAYKFKEHDLKFLFPNFGNTCKRYLEILRPQHHLKAVKINIGEQL